MRLSLTGERWSGYESTEPKGSESPSDPRKVASEGSGSLQCRAIVAQAKGWQATVVSAATRSDGALGHLRQQQGRKNLECPANSRHTGVMQSIRGLGVAAPLVKNQWTKRLYRATGVRPAANVVSGTRHFRMPSLEENGGYVCLGRYSGPEIAPEEWESLEYITYPTDTNTFFAPLTSATGETILRGFWDFGKPDLDGIWTSNAEKAPTLRRYVESVESRFGRVQLIRQQANSMRETRWALHLDDNNRLNPESNGWVVRLWLELTDDPGSVLVLRSREFDRSSEIQIPLPRGSQVVVDSERLFHAVHHGGPAIRYALITSFESSARGDQWIIDSRSDPPDPT
jgi:hypothetical protein